eukprot:scaffold1277_cov253-Pinguiococcus_pyrenoidosus.AAC.51
MSLTVPLSSASLALRMAAAPRSMLVCPSWPQACIWPSTVDLRRRASSIGAPRRIRCSPPQRLLLEGNLRKLPDGQGVDVGAQGHARRVSSAQLGHHAVAARPRNALVLPGVERPAGLVGHSQALEGALDDL